MKKTFTTALLLMGLSGAVLAGGRPIKPERLGKQKKQAYALVQAALRSQYQEAEDGHWKITAVTEAYQQAAYAHQGVRKSLFFTPDNARMVASIQLIRPEELSSKLVQKLARQYPGYEIRQVVKYYDGDTLYFVSLQKGADEVLVSYVQ